MWKGLSVLLSVGLLASLVVAGCGGGGSDANLQSGEEGNGPSDKMAPYIPAPGTVLTQRTVDWASLFQGPSRALDTPLTLGVFSNVVGAPTAGSVLEERLNLYSNQVTNVVNPIVWTATPVADASGNTGDNDLGILYASSGGAISVIATSTNVGPVEDWAAFDPYPYGTTRYFGLIWGVPGGPTNHYFQVEADRCSPLLVNGASKTGKENQTGSDWFHFYPVDLDGDGYPDPTTVNLTALGGTDPDVYVYDSAYGNGSAPVVVGANVGSDSVTYTPSWYRQYVRVYAFSGSPCQYTVAVTSP